MDHISRLNKTLEYIEENLDKDIHLDLIAKKFALSKYHFHRIFKVLTGDPPAKYIEKRRLSLAASDLISTKKSILDIALDYGFNSHESFTRSFKKHFSLTPSHFRKMRPDFDYYDTCQIAAIDLRLSKGEVGLNPAIVHKSEFSMAALTYSGHNKTKIYELWQNFWSLVNRREIIIDENECLGVCWHTMDMRNRELFDYHVGVVTCKNTKIPDSMRLFHLAESVYAAFTHRGPISKIEQTYDRIYGSWIIHSGNIPTMDLDILIVDDRFKGQSEDTEVDILIPVQG
jgi:AraC family transcriptional regulator